MPRTSFNLKISQSTNPIWHPLYAKRDMKSLFDSRNMSLPFVTALFFCILVFRDTCLPEIESSVSAGTVGNEVDNRPIDRYAWICVDIRGVHGRFKRRRCIPVIVCISSRCHPYIAVRDTAVEEHGHIIAQDVRGVLNIACIDFWPKVHGDAPVVGRCGPGGYIKVVVP